MASPSRQAVVGAVAADLAVVAATATVVADVLVAIARATRHGSAR